jgi:hypothetical protein
MEGLVYKGDLLSEEATVMSMVDELMRQEYSVAPTSQLQVWFWFLGVKWLAPLNPGSQEKGDITTLKDEDE